MNGSISFRIIFRILSRNFLIIFCAFLLCVVPALIYSESLLPFLFSALIALCGALLFHLFGKDKVNLEMIGKKEAYLAVTLSWVFLGLLGSLPYLFSRSIPSFINALFESVSGFTTTGSSILTDIEILPKSILFWRSLTHWIGGIGIIVIFIIVMPSLQIGGHNLFTLESSLQEKIHPRVKSVGYRLLIIYLTLTMLEIILLLLGRMSLFDSICHAFGTVATGGFSPKNSSIAGYSPYIQYVIMLFMLLAGTNFIIHYYLFKRQFKKIKTNDEVWYYLGFITLVGLILTFTVYLKLGKPFETSFREAFFQTISIITCTGFATADYMQWPSFAWTLLFVAMFLGGSTGSTAGGIKIARHVLLLRNIQRTFRQLINPNAVLPMRLNNNSINESDNNSILSFIAVYILVFMAGSLLMMLMGVEARESASSVATCMAGIGPGLGSVGPVGNFAQVPAMGKILLSFLMLVGRLEIFTVLMLFTKTFWKK